MKKLIVILAIIACASYAQAFDNRPNPLFSPFYESMRILAPMKMSQPAPPPPPPTQQQYQPPAEFSPPPQYLFTEDGQFMVIPMGNNTSMLHRMW